MQVRPNTYVLPGMPHLMREKWAAIRRLLNPAQPFHNQACAAVAASWETPHCLPLVQASSSVATPAHCTQVFRLKLSDETQV